MKFTIHCTLCDRPVIDILDAKEVRAWGLAVCMYCSTKGSWQIIDWDIRPHRNKDIQQFIYEDDEFDDADWWKK